MQTRPDDFYARPVVALLFALIGGIVLGCQFPGYTTGMWIISFLGAGYLGINIIRRKPAAVIPLLFFVAAGYISVQPWVSPSFNANHIHFLSDQTRWQITGVVGSHPVESKTFKRFILKASTLKHGKKSYRVAGNIRVTVRGQGPAFDRGDRVVFFSRLRQIRNFNNPGGFNYQRYMAFQGIWHTAYTNGDGLKILQKKTTEDLSQRINDFRLSISALIEKAGPGRSAAVLKALVIGERTAISQKIRDMFNRAGVSHILAISGLHIGIVATAAFLFFQKLLCFFRPFLWSAWTRKAAAILALIPVCIYALISGLSPSTQRAVIMVVAFLLTFLVQREIDSFNTLALAAFIILAGYPPSLFSISFQLSFAAVLSILYGLSCTRKMRNSDGPQVKTGFSIQVRRKVFALLMVSFFAVCGTLPLVMFYFNQISVIGLFTNIIVVPLVGFIVIPCGLVALFIYPFSSLIAFGCFKICILMLDYGLIIVEYLAELPFAAVKTFTPSLLEIGCYYALGWALMDWVNTRRATAESSFAICTGTDGDPPGTPYLSRVRNTDLILWIQQARHRLIVRLSDRRHVIIVAVICMVLVVDAGYWLGQRRWNTDLKVTYIDVGQGSATLLELPEGHTILVDGGGFSDNNAFDIGARVIAPFLWRKKIQTVDTLILSHPNSDHLNGLIYIAEHFNVKSVWTNGESRDTLGYQSFKEIVARRHIHFPDFKHMPRKRLINGVEVSILYPPSDFQDKKVMEKWRSSNNNSLVLKISFGDVSFLFPGDITEKAERDLVDRAGDKLACDVLLIPHHGSQSSSSRNFRTGVQADIAVISAGWKNRFRFPHPEVIEAYQNDGCQMLRTDRDGAIEISTDGKRLSVSPFLLTTD